MLDRQGNQNASHRPRRSWKRISIRALLVCTAMLAIYFARWSTQRRLEREIEEIVVNHGGGFNYDWDERFRGRFWKRFESVDDFFVRRDLSVGVNAANLTTLERTRLFDLLGRYGRVELISVRGADDDVLKKIGQSLTGLTELLIEGRSVTDDGLAYLSGLENDDGHKGFSE